MTDHERRLKFISLLEEYSKLKRPPNVAGISSASGYMAGYAIGLIGAINFSWEMAIELLEEKINEEKKKKEKTLDFVS